MLGPYGADEDIAGTSTDIAGASDDDVSIIISDEDGAIGVSEDGAIGVSLDKIDMTVETSDDIELMTDSTEDSGAAEEDDGAASLELTAELDGATGVTGVGVPRLKIQIRPTITTTATMMIIQVLRFI